MTDPARIAEGLSEAQVCNECSKPADMLFHGLCRSCEIDSNDYDERGDCFQCGGDGYVYGCGWDWQCDTYDEGEGTCLCSKRCDVCNPAELTPEEQAERDALRKVLADALTSTPAILKEQSK